MLKILTQRGFLKGYSPKLVSLSFTCKDPREGNSFVQYDETDGFLYFGYSQTGDKCNLNYIVAKQTNKHTHNYIVAIEAK